MTAARLVVDGRPLEFRDGDSVAVAIVRAGDVPGQGGCLCLAGDCGNCLAEVDGVAYVRTCEVPARPGTVVRRHPRRTRPPLPTVDFGDLTRAPGGSDVAVRRAHAAVAFVGSAEHAPTGAVVLDPADGVEVVGIYPGPAIVARAPGAMLHLTAEQIVVG